MTWSNPLPPKDGIQFDKTDISHHLTSFLYPDDSDETGRLLRLYQQYFMVSAGAQLILSELAERGHQPSELDCYVAIHINDTHHSMVIPEMIRLLMEDGMPFDQAADVVERTCAYTNHTILAEALETWPMRFIEQVAPGIVPIIRKLDERARSRSNDERVAVIDSSDCVHMAHMDVHLCHAVNGVAALHTHILTSSEMRPFAELYPSKFSNKTNGITFRRWLLDANPALARCITERIGDGWVTDAQQLSDLLSVADADALTGELEAIKQHNKRALASWLQRTQGIKVDPESVFDIQIKRMHQYKRQQMNALYAIWKYLHIKRGNVPTRPVTMIFAAKAAPAYELAKDTIALLLALSRLIEQDPAVSPWLRLVMVENYNVTAAEHLIPAADISEQISLASKEASGTSNMKFMANGAVTLGTLDGANVEIAEQAGSENEYIFGATVEEINMVKPNYNARSFYEANPNLRRAVDTLIDGTVPTDEEQHELYTSLLKGASWHKPDQYFIFYDFDSYKKARLRVNHDYCDRIAFGRKCLMNVASAGKFSSDRTIRQYAEDIWHIQPVK